MILSKKGVKFCPECGSKTAVYDCRTRYDRTVRRRRECFLCGAKYTTVEQTLDATKAQKKAIEEIKKERDALMEALRGQCPSCKYKKYSSQNEPCLSCGGDSKNWEWVGINN